MPLSKSDSVLIQKALNVGSSDLAIPLSSDAKLYLAWTVIRDLGLQAHFPEHPQLLPAFFGSEILESIPPQPGEFKTLIEQLAELDENSVSYFFCLASLFKARFKYSQILRYQPVPSMDQVGPRGLLQFGTVHPHSLAGFMLWRKWMFDIDNRAGQETGYLFEPIIASAVGGTSCSATKSPVRRENNNKKGRQIDCLLDDRAYEFKVRVTIAASGQGRWGEELQYPVDCRTSGFVPVLVVFDPTPNPKLTELCAVFEANGGETYVGETAWEHLDEVAGASMARFLETYVRIPLDALLDEVEVPLPPMRLTMSNDSIDVIVGNDGFSIPRPNPQSD